MMIRANWLSEHTRFVCIRGGNVLGTSGSVVPLFRRQIDEGKSLTITDKGMTRFFLTRTEAIYLLLKAAEAAVGGETFVMKMKACNMTDLASVMLEQAGRPASDYKVTGIRPGEKLHEVLISPYEAPRTYQYDEQYYVILPQELDKRLTDAYRTLPRVTFPEYGSDSDLMKRQAIAEFCEQAAISTNKGGGAFGGANNARQNKQPLPESRRDWSWLCWTSHGGGDGTGRLSRSRDRYRCFQGDKTSYG